MWRKYNLNESRNKANSKDAKSAQIEVETHYLIISLPPYLELRMDFEMEYKLMCVVHRQIAVASNVDISVVGIRSILFSLNIGMNNNVNWRCTWCT